MCEILSFGCYIIFSIWSLATIDLHFSDFYRHRLWKSLVGSTHRNSVSHPSPRENASESSGPSIHSQSFEGVRLENLTKVFRLSKGVTRTAVNDLTIEFRLGEVTALLGHNGAGKSTTMWVITDPDILGNSHVQNILISATCCREWWNPRPALRGFSVMTSGLILAPPQSSLVSVPNTASCTTRWLLGNISCSTENSNPIWNRRLYKPKFTGTYHLHLLAP